ncbi:hypothetical protein PEBR_34432 [Penicillium brasilianum]|uniref:Aminoglycoside phosphotransferase domain-containing protein n=1 Tax=Penicillium brasilianum TaxID=104259 RepID=A0A1S9REM8_PENBI|nr:hypothetical protein PEBR_34432 [Penicillium brasilianum]
MRDPAHPDCPVIAMLDWEFSGVVPAPRWNSPRAFLWNIRKYPKDKAGQSRMEDVFKANRQERGLEKILDELLLNPLQNLIDTVVNDIPAVVKVCPREKAQDRVGQWRKVAETALDRFGV